MTALYRNADTPVAEAPAVSEIQPDPEPLLESKILPVDEAQAVENIEKK